MTTYKSSSVVLYKNSNAQLKKHFVIMLISAIVFALLMILGKESIWSSIEILQTKITVLYFIACIISVFYIGQSIVNILKYRNVVINKKGIEKYWLFPSIANKFISFNEIAISYSSEIDFDKIYKNQDVIIPIVFDAGLTSTSSQQYRDGNDLIIYTKDFQVEVFYNLDDVTQALSVINEKKHEYDIKNNSNAGVTNNINDAAQKISDNKKVKEKVLVEVKMVYLPMLFWIIFILFVGIPSINIPVISLIVLWNVIAFLFFSVLILTAPKKQKLQITTNAIKLYDEKNRIKYSCFASNIEHCEIRCITYKKRRTYRLEITNKEQETYTINNIKNVDKIVNGINFMMLINAKILDNHF